MKGIANNNPSNRSKIPPCPGKIFPESLMFRLLFIKLSTKSPSVPVITTINAITAQSIELNSVKKCANICDAAVVNINAPINPSHDFLGDIRSNSRRFPIDIPTKYANVSLLHCKTKYPITMLLL